MAARFRDTAFGQILRFLSGNKLFRYPDEIDLSLWEKSRPQGSPSTSSPSRGQADADSSTKEFDTQDIDSRHRSANHVVEDGQDVWLVDWYGLDDPEVSAPNWFHATKTTFLSQESRIPKIGLAAGRLWLLFKCTS